MVGLVTMVEAYAEVYEVIMTANPGVIDPGGFPLIILFGS
jgi:hypothetical protein